MASIHTGTVKFIQGPALPFFNQRHYPRSVIELKVSWEMSMSYISLICAEISRKLMPIPYMPIMRSCKLSAKIVSRFLTIDGLKLPLRSRLLISSTSPSLVLTVLLTLPFFRLNASSGSSDCRCSSSSDCSAASKNCLSKGEKASPLPVRLLPERNCSRVSS